MEKLDVKVIFLGIAVLLIIFDVLKNIKVFTSKKIILVGILSFLSLSAYIFLIIFYPTQGLLIFIFLVVGIRQSWTFWRLRTTKEKNWKNAMILICLLVAALVYSLIQNYG
ncbi:MAG: hypothetical protein HQ522_00420 [Bacteroidetes bacterium]|nr:hypothetical protein [Bacteroidota bacterium]